MVNVNILLYAEIINGLIFDSAYIVRYSPLYYGLLLKPINWNFIDNHVLVPALACTSIYTIKILEQGAKHPSILLPLKMATVSSK